MGQPTSGLGEALARQVIEWRRAIHRNPELANTEHDTQALVRRALAAAGIESVEAVAGTGLVTTIHGRGPGRTLALRADMDALPIQEARDLPFASENPGIMHACGHDAHTAILLGTTFALHESRGAFAGTVRCVFQPAEEAEPLGGRAVVASGVLDGAEGILALHVDPDIPAGDIGVRAGALLAGGQEFTITVAGVASHAAKPHRGVDAIAAGAAIVQELQKIPSRRVDPLEPVVVTIGRFQAGTAKNVIADRAVLEGTLRVLDEGVRRDVVRMIGEVARHVAAAHGATATLDTIEGEPVLMNDPALTALVRGAAGHVVGPGRVHEIARPSMGSEDFAFYVEAAPVTMFRLGVRNEAEAMTHPLHHPAFAIDETAIPVGAAVMLESARRFLDGEG